MKKEIKLIVLAIILFIVNFISSKFSILNSGFFGGCFTTLTGMGGIMAILDAISLHFKRRKKIN
ncbi:MAG: hypothetical protein ACRCWG_02280 [Sarcina sp.]